MKEFLKYTFATVCGLILTGVVFTILGIISLAGMVASTSGTETIVKDRSVFVLELKGSVMERYQENPIMQKTFSKRDCCTVFTIGANLTGYVR